MKVFCYKGGKKEEFVREVTVSRAALTTVYGECVCNKCPHVPDLKERGYAHGFWAKLTNPMVQCPCECSSSDVELITMHESGWSDGRGGGYSAKDTVFEYCKKCKHKHKI